jgi:chromo domain-containing protein 1
MTERTITKLSLREDDEDSISITSTQESETNEEKSYVVDRILAEQDDGEGNVFYLIKWDRYKLLDSTWEPAENIESRATLDEWNTEKMRIARGLSDPFDVAAFDDEIEKVQLAKAERRRRRKAKRERLGITASPSEPEEIPTSATENEDSQHEAGSVIFQKEKKIVPSGNSLKTSVRKGESKTKSSASRTASVREDTTEASEDSCVEEVPQEARKSRTRARGTGKRPADVSARLNFHQLGRITEGLTGIEIPTRRYIVFIAGLFSV